MPEQQGFFNPFSDLKNQIDKRIDEIKHDVKVAVEVVMFRALVQFGLSRLITLDPGRSAAYQAAEDLVGE